MTSEQVLATLIAHVSEQHELLGRQLDAQKSLLYGLRELASKPQPAQGRFIARWFNNHLPPEQLDVARAIYEESVINIAYSDLKGRLSDAALTLDNFWRIRTIRPDGSIRQFNAVLTLALGPDAPQFYASGEGWELRDYAE